MTDFTLQAAKMIPKSIRDAIIEENLIDIAQKTFGGKTMEYLFDVYEHFIDKAGEHDDYNCTKCRSFVLNEWVKIKPYLQEIYENA